MATRNYRLYCLTSPSDKFYIGITSSTIKERFRLHVQRAVKGCRNHPLCCAIRKYGASAFVLTELSITTNHELIKELEIEAIQHYRDTYTPGRVYNLSRGGDYDAKTGASVFWERYRSDPEYAAAYRAKLCEAQRGGTFSEKAILAAAEWKRTHTRQMYRQVCRASRMSASRRGCAPKTWVDPLTLPLTVRLEKRNRRSVAVKAMHAARSEAAKMIVRANISRAQKEVHRAKTPKQRAVSLAQLAKGRANTDRKEQGRRASEGQKQFWVEIRKDPERYEAYMSGRTATLMRTLDAKKNI